jgi:hypothetical protein
MLTPSELELLQLKQFEIAFISTATKVFAEAVKINRLWQHWEAINNLLSPDEPDAVSLLADLAQSQMDRPLDDIRKVLARDVILRTVGLSERLRPKNLGERHRSLSQLSADLGDPRISSWLSSEARFAGAPWSGMDALRLSHDVGKRIELFLKTFGTATGDDEALPEYSALRRVMGVTRNAIIDSVPIDQKDAVQVKQIRAFIQMNFDMSADLMFVADAGIRSSSQLKNEGLVFEQPRVFWSAALKGLRSV